MARKLLVRFFGLVLFLAIFPTSLVAEECVLPSYGSDSTCGGNCPIAQCQDTSGGQGAQTFQCCPAFSNLPESPGRWPVYGPLAGVAIVGGVLALRLRRRVGSSR